MPQLKGREGICPSFAFQFRLGSQQIGWCLSTMERVVLFTQATDSCMNLLTDTPSNEVFSQLAEHC